MGVPILIAVLVIVIFIALRSSLKHLRGQSGCCGGGAELKTEEKILQAPLIMEKIVTIEGMHCKNCENSVARALNCLEGVAAKASYQEGKAILSLSSEHNDAEIRMIIYNLGFSVINIETKTFEH